jgi:hypothetical protein
MCEAVTDTEHKLWIQSIRFLSKPNESSISNFRSSIALNQNSDETANQKSAWRWTKLANVNPFSDQTVQILMIVERTNLALWKRILSYWKSRRGTQRWDVMKVLKRNQQRSWKASKAWTKFRFTWNSLMEDRI